MTGTSLVVIDPIVERGKITAASAVTKQVASVCAISNPMFSSLRVDGSVSTLCLKLLNLVLGLEITVMGIILSFEMRRVRRCVTKITLKACWDLLLLIVAAVVTIATKHRIMSKSSAIDTETREGLLSIHSVIMIGMLLVKRSNRGKVVESITNARLLYAASSISVDILLGPVSGREVVDILPNAWLLLVASFGVMSILLGRVSIRKAIVVGIASELL
jgi:hypothetical protein